MRVCSEVRGGGGGRKKGSERDRESFCSIEEVDSSGSIPGWEGWQISGCAYSISMHICLHICVFFFFFFTFVW